MIQYFLSPGAEMYFHPPSYPCIVANSDFVVSHSYSPQLTIYNRKTKMNKIYPLDDLNKQELSNWNSAYFPAHMLLQGSTLIVIVSYACIHKILSKIEKLYLVYLDLITESQIIKLVSRDLYINDLKFSANKDRILILGIMQTGVWIGAIISKIYKEFDLKGEELKSIKNEVELEDALHEVYFLTETQLLLCYKKCFKIMDIDPSTFETKFSTSYPLSPNSFSLNNVIGLKHVINYDIKAEKEFSLVTIRLWNIQEGPKNHRIIQLEVPYPVHSVHFIHSLGSNENSDEESIGLLCKIFKNYVIMSVDFSFRNNEKDCLPSGYKFIIEESLKQHLEITNDMSLIPFNFFF